MTQRRPFIAGNWKMNKTIDEAIDFVTKLQEKLNDSEQVDILVAPPALAIHPVAQALPHSSPIQIAAQNVHPEPAGAFTGELSAPMLKAAGASHCLVGHSERRQLFHEDDAFLNRKLKALLKEQLKPIFCIGESLEEREAGKTFERVASQLTEGLKNISKEELLSITIAYEPIWAIGTGKTATPEQAQEVHAFLRSQLAQLYDEKTSQQIRILYGGSVKPNNIRQLMQQNDIDGALVGGASLDVDSFLQLIRFHSSI